MRLFNPMMSTLEQILQPVAAEMEVCGKYMREHMIADEPLVQSMMDYIIDNRGKGLRPLLVLLSSKINSSEPLGERTYLSAMLVEMIHTASLVHDDVIDESPMRRGNQSVNGRWGANSAVLCGDYLLATAFDTGMRTREYDIPSYIIRAMKDLCTGELIQNEFNRRADMTRADYLNIINKKTAVLLATSASVGAVAVSASADTVERMRLFGEALGMAFQIQDDILDYDVCADTGKPSCNDLREGKITLPLLAVMEQMDDVERASVREMLRTAHSNAASVSHLHDLVQSRGGIDGARRTMNEYLTKARSLAVSYPDSPCRASLLLMCDFVGERRR